MVDILAFRRCRSNSVIHRIVTTIVPVQVYNTYIFRPNFSELLVEKLKTEKKVRTMVLVQHVQFRGSLAEHDISWYILFDKSFFTQLSSQYVVLATIYNVK